MGKRRILWVSDLVTPTGFSRVAHSIIGNIKDDFDITGIGINYFGDPHKFGFDIYPASMGGDVYGEKRLVDVLLSREFDVLLILNDVWVIDRYLTAIKKYVPENKIPKIVIYTPVDADNHDPDWYKNFDLVSKTVLYTEYAKGVVLKAAPHLKPEIIPHGVDTNLFYKKFNTRREAKIDFFSTFLGDGVENSDFVDSFIVLNGNRNQPRKKIDITIEGFAKFAKDKPKNVKLYMHCGIVDASMNVVKLAIRYGIDDRIIVSSTKPGVQTVPDYRLNAIYNATDVGINTSLGEGWGLVNVEHAVTGAPQIVPDHSACRELFSDCGVLVPVHTKWVFDNSMTVGGVVSSDDVANALEELYSNRKLLEELGNVSMKKFTSNEYNWVEISKKWKRIFEEV